MPTDECVTNSVNHAVVLTGYNNGQGETIPGEPVWVEGTPAVWVDPVLEWVEGTAPQEIPGEPVWVEGTDPVWVEGTADIWVPGTEGSCRKASRREKRAW